MEFVFQPLDWREKGIKIDGEYLSHLRFADDIIVFASNQLDLEEMMKELAVKSKNVGLTLNAKKTKVMSNGILENICINGEQIESVKEYIYLGQSVSFENQTGREVHRRIALAWNKYWSLKEIMKNKQINLNIKKKVYETIIMPSLTYGCQTWTLRKEDEEKLAVSQRKMERSMIGIKLNDRISNINIRQKTKLYDIVKRVRILKWNWAGHVCRMDNTRWAKRLTEWIPRDRKRKQGRPRKRWRDVFKENIGPDWMRQSRDRILWRKLGEAYAERRLLPTETK